MTPRVKIERVLLLGWDTISEKYLYQIEALINSGYSVSIVTNDALARSQQVVDMLVSHHLVRLHVIPRALALKPLVSIYYIFKYRDSIACLLGISSRISWINRIFCGLVKIPVIAVSWGDVLELKFLRQAERLSLIFCLKTATAVWNKEPIMTPILKSLTKRPIFFIPNAVPLDLDERINFESRDLDFLWVNRPVRGRSPLETIKTLIRLSETQQLKARIMGWKDKAALDKWLEDNLIDEQALNSLGISLATFSNPEPYYRKAKFFILISDFVFGNNSLLEAMSYGVVPIVNDSPGIDYLIQGKLRDYLVLNDSSSLEVIANKALNIDPSEWDSLSQHSISKVRSDFKIIEWQRSMNILLESVAAQSRST
jgi:glycosyltransferase involved in cell wall biosynthesis